ncbi:MAG TPA: isoprenylcysteine carboxylmethyltransferase family protein [Bryobacteraceae bacterium]|nr:isoprenylcysteine carboxylmethyltransferase family protein [Bryobacteraceae bacterium]
MREPRRRALAILGTVLFLIAPATVAVLVPFWISRWRVQTPLLGLAVFRVIGALLAGAGVCILLESYARFALQGLGTPAPVFPTRRLVVTGLYRHVRNPIYLALVSMIIGQGLVFGSPRVLAYGVFVWLACHVFVVAHEEPALRRTFGHEYETFRANVPRWRPRMRPWRGDRV